MKNIMVISKQYLDGNGNTKVIANFFDNNGVKINDVINRGRVCKNGLSFFTNSELFNYLMKDCLVLTL